MQSIRRYICLLRMGCTWNEQITSSNSPSGERIKYSCGPLSKSDSYRPISSQSFCCWSLPQQKSSVEVYESGRSAGNHPVLGPLVSFAIQDTNWIDHVTTWMICRSNMFSMWSAPVLGQPLPKTHFRIMWRFTWKLMPSLQRSCIPREQPCQASTAAHHAFAMCSWNINFFMRSSDASQPQYLFCFCIIAYHILHGLNSTCEHQSPIQNMASLQLHLVVVWPKQKELLLLIVICEGCCGHYMGLKKWTRNSYIELPSLFYSLQIGVTSLVA